MAILDSEAETAKKKQNRRLREQTGERGCARLSYRALWGETSHRQRCVCWRFFRYRSISHSRNTLRDGKHSTQTPSLTAAKCLSSQMQRWAVLTERGRCIAERSLRKSYTSALPSSGLYSQSSNFITSRFPFSCDTSGKQLLTVAPKLPTLCKIHSSNDL